MMGGLVGGGGKASAQNVGSGKGVPFSRVVTVADTAFATVTVTLPRSSVPSSIFLSITAGAALCQIQGNGTEMYAAAFSVNQTVLLPLPAFPETTSINVQLEQLAASTAAGVVFYN